MDISRNKKETKQRETKPPQQNLCVCTRSLTPFGIPLLLPASIFYHQPLGFEGSRSEDIVWRTIAAVGVEVADVANLPRKQVPERISCHQQIVTFGVCHADLPWLVGSQRTNSV